MTQSKKDLPDEVELIEDPEDQKDRETTSEAEKEAKWYVIHTYSGYENKVQTKIQMIIENQTHETIFDVRVPTEQVVENKNGERVVKERKILPGYVIVKMIITPQSWYLVRNTQGVTGFVGSANTPVPLTPAEIAQFGVREQVRHRNLEVSPGDKVQIIYGPFAGFTADVEEVNQEKQIIRGLITMFGRETSVELSFDDVEVD